MPERQKMFKHFTGHAKVSVIADQVAISETINGESLVLYFPLCLVELMTENEWDHETQERARRIRASREAKAEDNGW